MQLIIMFTVARSLMKRESLQLNDSVSVHLMNLEYVTLVLTDLEDDAIILLLVDQSQRFRHLCMSGLHKIWSKVNRYTR